MPYVLMERTFDNPLNQDALEVMLDELNPCLSRYDAVWRESFLSSDRTRMICLFEAPDAESVRTAYRMAGYEFETVWPAERLASPESSTPHGTR